MTGCSGGKKERLSSVECEVRSVEAWAEGEDSWSWNSSCFMFKFKTRAADIKRAFLKKLRCNLLSNGGNLGRGWYRVECWDGSLYELVNRKDGCPMFACIVEC